MRKKFLTFEDLFEVKCKKCGSTDVDVSSDECSQCGSNVVATCNNCGSKYDYHKFKQIEVEDEANE